MSINKAYKETQKRRKKVESRESGHQGQDIDDAELAEQNESETDHEEDYEEMGEDETDETDEDDCEVWDEQETEKKPFMVVRISLEQYQALDEWTREDSIEELVEQAIDRYLNELEEEYADSADDLEHEE